MDLCACDLHGPWAVMVDSLSKPLVHVELVQIL